MTVNICAKIMRRHLCLCQIVYLFRRDPCRFQPRCKLDGVDRRQRFVIYDPQVFLIFRTQVRNAAHDPVEFLLCKRTQRNPSFFRLRFVRLEVDPVDLCSVEYEFMTSEFVSFDSFAVQIGFKRIVPERPASRNNAVRILQHRILFARNKPQIVFPPFPTDRLVDRVDNSRIFFVIEHRFVSSGQQSAFAHCKPAAEQIDKAFTRRQQTDDFVRDFALAPCVRNSVSCHCQPSLSLPSCLRQRFCRFYRIKRTINITLFACALTLLVSTIFQRFCSEICSHSETVNPNKQERKNRKNNNNLVHNQTSLSSSQKNRLRIS